MSVAELCREAHVSRSTFYEHFGNVADDAWPDVKVALDRFILGGVSACLAAPPSRV